eukprot:TRINITY_DN2004_c0_g1_i1.p1 TRINITY_DN2004_c0_g1~~TRINITY_DN2004_c0_g1_i1.p1  ORF type:complete len:328 (-),score=78.04 TRINITY_DN2004_c0_g1_i1:95-970(-)
MERCNSEKAMRLLGRNHGEEKLMKSLGITEKDMANAAQDRLKRFEEEFKRQREKEPIKSKKESMKALEILGLDVSREKVKSLLGVPDNIIEEAASEVADRENLTLLRKRSHSVSIKKDISKALDLLGHDPSKEKVMNTLGIDEFDLIEHEKERGMTYEIQCRRKRTNSWLNKKEAGKALKILGYEPSKMKVITTLGILEEDLQQVQVENQEREEEINNEIIQKNMMKNKRGVQKALKVLGHDPSLAKLETLGFGKKKITLLSTRSQIYISLVIFGLLLFFVRFALPLLTFL